MARFLNKLVTELSENTSHVGESSGEFSNFIDTGSYTLNAACGGSIFTGMPNNKVIGIAGEEATGKTFLLLGIMKNFLDADKDSEVLDYDTEGALTKEMLKARGIDVDRFGIAEPETIQDFTTHALKTLELYGQQNDRSKFMMALDSLGMLPTMKELADSTEGKNVADMTRAKTLRSAFRSLTLKLAKYQIPLFVTNHVYEVVGSYVPTKAMGGGGGLKYAASIILFLSKRKERDADKNVIGNIVTVTVNKSRLTKENKKVEVLITYDKGLDRYYGLVDLALEYGIFKKQGKKILLPNGESMFESRIYKNAPTVFTKELLIQIDEFVKKDFQYGSSIKDIDLDEEEDEE